ncbi:MAG: M56 family metallopeptidase [Gammaproteobacteria bacterium]
MPDAHEAVAVFAGLATSLGVGAALALFHPPLVRFLRSFPPELRAAGCAAFLGMPLAMGVLAAVLCKVAADGLVLDLVTHHCHASAVGCEPHAAMSTTLALMIATGVVVAMLFVSLAWRTASQAVPALRALRLLHAASTPIRASGLGLVDSDAAVACATGLLKPRLFLSRGLWRRLDLTELKVVLRHERAHLARHDHHVRLLAAVISLGHWPDVARRLFGELVLAQEQACDRVAARYYGALRTAETVLKVERMSRGSARAATMSTAFADAPVVARIQALLEPH